MLQIADMTFQFQHLTAITQTLWARLSDDRGGKAWRTVYKGLLLLDYVLKNGSEQFVNDARHHSRILNGPSLSLPDTVLRSLGLSRFHYVDTEGVDRGVSVRERANIVMELMHDTKRLRDERKKAKANRGKFSQSISNQYGGFGNSPGAFQGGGGGGMSGYGGFGRDSPQWSTNPDADVFGDSSDDDLAPSSSSKSKPKRKGGDDDEWDPFSEGTFSSSLVVTHLLDSSSAKKTSRDPAFAAPASTKSQATNDDDEWASFVGSSSTAATTKSAAPPPASTAPPVDLLGALNLEPTAPSGGNPLSAFSNPSTPAASANASSAPMLGGLLAPTPSSPSPATGGSGLLGASSPAKPTTSLNPTDPFDFGFGTSTTTTPTTSSKPLSSVTPAANYNVPVGTFGMFTRLLLPSVSLLHSCITFLPRSWA